MTVLVIFYNTGTKKHFMIMAEFGTQYTIWKDKSLYISSLN